LVNNSMTQEARVFDASDLPDVSQLVHEVNRSGQPLLIEADGEAARLSPARRALEKRNSRGRRRAFTRDDPLFGLIGTGEGKTPGGVSGNKHEALARAHRPK
jgi:hypothetical protein